MSKKSMKQGQAPGTVMFTGEQKMESSILSLISYTPEVFNETTDLELERLSTFASDKTSWLNLDGVHDTSLIEHLGRHFNLHPLTLEDIASTQQRPKIEFFDDYVYVVLRMLHLSDKGTLQNEQISIILGKHFVLTLQEIPGDLFEPVRKRLRTNKGRIRKLGADYLFYALIDAIVDAYFIVLESYGERIEALEDQILHYDKQVIEQLSSLKRETLLLRKTIWPLRELLSSLHREESPLMSNEVLTFFRDVQDHSIQVIDTIEIFRELLSSIHDVHLSNMSYRMNEVMKVLTIISTIFIPLSFLVGVYGMNFKVMPELEWQYGYFGVWGIILFVAISMVFYFRRKKWF
jgi:magnesium transporter